MTASSAARQPLTPRGFLVAIDGPVGVGKTTVTALVAARLAAAGLPTVATRQPSDSAMGKIARSSTHVLHGLALTFLMAADRYHHYERVIGPALAAGQVVVCDRYVISALVLDQADGADPGFIWGIYSFLAWPDLAIVLAGDPPTCRARAERRGVYSRFHEGGAAAAEAEAALYANSAAVLVGRGYPVVVVPIGDLSADDVAGTVTTLVRERLSGSPHA
jgi:dTMP kinase